MVQMFENKTNDETTTVFLLIPFEKIIVNSKSQFALFENAIK